MVGEVLDPEEISRLRERARTQIRARVRALRQAIPEARLAERSRLIEARIALLPAYREARSVALFWPLSREVDLRNLDLRARGEAKLVYYPVMDPTETGVSTGFALSRDVSELGVRSSKFLEPPADAPRARRGEIDLILVPALAVAANGHRLGYGRGFYDVTLPDFRPPALAVVVAYDFQLLAELPELAHDVASDLVVTDTRTLSVSGG
jgi:5-formyltetrahydrofolate cyclo-ligase